MVPNFDSETLNLHFSAITSAQKALIDSIPTTYQNITTPLTISQQDQVSKTKSLITHFLSIQNPDPNTPLPLSSITFHDLSSELNIVPPENLQRLKKEAFIGFKINDNKFGYGLSLYKKKNLEEITLIYNGLFLENEFHGEDITINRKDGSILFKGSKNRGKKIGLCEAYWENGALISKIFYNSLGNPEDEVKQFWSNGQLWNIYNYTNGLEQGKSEEWWENGNLAVTQYYVNGVRETWREEYHSNGNLKAKYFFRNGNIDMLDCKTYFNNGQLKMQCNYKDGKIQGNIRIYCFNGKLAYQGQVWTRQKYFVSYYPRSCKADVQVFNDDGCVYAGRTLGKPVVHPYYRGTVDLPHLNEYADIRDEVP